MSFNPRSSLTFCPFSIPAKLLKNQLEYTLHRVYPGPLSIFTFKERFEFKPGGLSFNSGFRLIPNKCPIQPIGHPFSFWDCKFRGKPILVQGSSRKNQILSLALKTVWARSGPIEIRVIGTPKEFSRNDTYDKRFAGKSVSLLPESGVFQPGSSV